MEKSGGSRLLQMQAKYQQRQLQERELKIASVYEAQQARALDRVRHSPSNGNSPTPVVAVPHQPGKVRQMFEERRTRAGIDKSYPLQPIQNTERTRKPVTNGHSKVTTTTRSTEKKTAVKTSTSVSSTTTKAVRRQPQKTQNNIINGSGDLNHNHEPDLNSVKRTLPHSNGDLLGGDELDNHNNYMLDNETFPEELAPTATPRSPEVVEPTRPPRRSPAAKISSQTVKSKSPPMTKTEPQPVTPPRKTVVDNITSESGKARGAMQRVNNPVTRKSQPVVGISRGADSASKRTAQSSEAEGAACSVCGRRFASDRLAVHEQICKRTGTKKRKPFDVLKHRLAGTEAEPFIGKLRKQAKTTTSTSLTKVNKPLNNNWRQKHQEFIQAIRAAKQVQQHLNAGGKLSDLPPPPPSENPDYVQCPHCNRRFNEGAAQRHIPKCANYQFNKSKPGAQSSKKR